VHRQERLDAPGKRERMQSEDGDAQKIERYLADPAATQEFGAALARRVSPGTVVLLDGPLGAGKTTLVQGFCAELGATAAASPSFVLAHRYDGARFPIWHLDLYRVEDATEIEDLDLAYYTPSDGVCLVEWAARAPGPWPQRTVSVSLRFDGNGRIAVVSGVDADGAW
jgi:tRNA threonylcarbamoyladenosine biosynthesis protein TsaE